MVIQIGGKPYSFFAGLSMDQINTLARAADEEKVEAGHFFFRYVMMTKAAQVTRDRIASMNIEFLAYLAGETGGK